MIPTVDNARQCSHHSLRTWSAVASGSSSIFEGRVRGQWLAKGCNYIWLFERDYFCQLVSKSERYATWQLKCILKILVTALHSRFQCSMSVCFVASCGCAVSCLTLVWQHWAFHMQALEYGPCPDRITYNTVAHSIWKWTLINSHIVYTLSTHMYSPLLSMGKDGQGSQQEHCILCFFDWVLSVCRSWYPWGHHCPGAGQPLARGRNDATGLKWLMWLYVDYEWLRGECSIQRSSWRVCCAAMFCLPSSN